MIADKQAVEAYNTPMDSRALRRGNMKYKIGQILTAKEDFEVTTALSETKSVIKKGSRVIVGADKLAHHFNGMIQPISKDIEIKGYDSSGIAEYLMDWMSRRFPLTEFMEDYEISEKDLHDELGYALDEIGL